MFLIEDMAYTHQIRDAPLYLKGSLSTGDQAGSQVE